MSKPIEQTTGVIGITCPEHARYSKFAASVANLNRPEGWHVKYAIGASVAEGRNQIIRHALGLNLDYVFFLDDDLLMGREALLTLLSTEQDAVVGLSFQRYQHFAPLWFHTFGSSGEIRIHMEQIPPPGTLLPIAWATAGGVLVSTKALRQMPDPWFRVGLHGNADNINEDLDFYMQLSEAGVQLYGCSSVIFGHMSQMDVWPNYDAENGWQAALAYGDHVFAVYRLQKETACATK
jgi:cellulose synthase/poly-beta-1,6-N-acetylglucosamine synthase-like glycosyltransferase